MTVAANTPTELEMKEVLSSLWWMPLIRGILLILFAILMFVQPGSTLLSLIWFMGIYWIVDGVFCLIEGVRGHAEKSRLWMFIGGVVSILAGFFIVGNPIAAGMVGGTFLVYLIGITTIITGVMMIFAGRDGHWTWWGVIMGILYIVFGIFIVANPLMTLATLVWLIPIWALVSGIFAVALSFQLRTITE
ncbi:MAG: DUF308 domain-containing protein [Chloroflexota bacterium]